MKTISLRIIIVFLLGLFLSNYSYANLYDSSYLDIKSCEDERGMVSDDYESCNDIGSRTVPELEKSVTYTFKSVGSTNVGGFTQCINQDSPDPLVRIGIDRNAFFGSGQQGQNQQPSESYLLDFETVASAFPCLDEDIDVEDIILTITIENVTSNFPPQFACCDNLINGVFANLYNDCDGVGGTNNLCPVIGDGLVNATPNIGDCSPSGDNLNYNGNGIFDFPLPYSSTVTCLNLDADEALSIDIIPNVDYEASGCNCPSDLISQGYIDIEFSVSLEYVFCENDLDEGCSPFSISLTDFGGNPLPEPYCDNAGFIFLPTVSNDGTSGTWSTQTGIIDGQFWDVSSLGGTTGTVVFTPNSGECSTTPYSIDLTIDYCCSADGGSYTGSNDDPQTIGSEGGNFQTLNLSGDLNNFNPSNISDMDLYIILLTDANGVILDSDIDLGNIDFPENTTDMPIDYCIYGLSYKIFPGLGVITNGVTTINIGDGDVITDGNGNPLVDAAMIESANTSCMDLSTNCVTITVEPAITCSMAGMDAALDLCTDANTIVNFFDALDGTPDEGGIWTDGDSAGVDLSDPATVDIAALTTGTYNFTYTFAADGSCELSEATLTLNIDNPPNAGMDNTIDLCSANSSSINLFSSLMGMPDTNGDWDDLNGSGVDITDPMNVDFIGVTTGSYDFVYTIVTDGACSSEGAVLTVNITAASNAGTNGSTSICAGGSSIVNLMTTLNDSPDMGGMWTENSASGVNLADPTNVDFAGVAAGDYTFTYTIVGGECDDAFAIATVSIGEAPSAGTSTSTSVCNDGSLLNFEQQLGMPDAGGVWTDDNISGVNISNPTAVDFTEIAANTYNFTYTIAASGTCSESTATLTVMVFDNPDAGENGAITYCIGASAPINLVATLGGLPDANGTWLDTNSSGADISDPTNVDFSTIAVGMYDFTYTVLGESGICSDDSAIITVNVIDQPNFGMNSFVSFCEGETNTQDFFNLINAGQGGLWMDTDASGIDVSNPIAVDLSTLNDGIYNFDYTIMGTVECPGGSSNLEITILNTPTTGTANPALMICDDNTTLVNLFDLLEGEEMGGIWTETSVTPSSLGAFNAVMGTFDPTGQAAQNYTFDYSILATAPCNNANTSVEITIDAVPQIDLGDDINQCVGDGIITLDAQNAGATYTWTVNPDDGNNGASTQTITIADNAIQTMIGVEVSQNNCSATDDINITTNNPPNFVENAKDCSADLSSYTVTFTTNGDMVSTSAGTVTDNMNGTFTISDITNGTDISITITNSTTNCSSDFDIIAPDCGCDTVNPPTGMDVAICSDEAIPALVASADMGLEINWYDAPSNGTILATNATIFTPAIAGTYYVEALNSVTNCTSLLVPIVLTINDIPIVSESDKLCSSDLLTYSVIITTNGDAIQSPEGDITNNMDGTFTISGIGSGTDFMINIIDSITDCNVEYSIIAPDCSCNVVNSPTGMDMEICSGEMIPALTASADMGLEVNWYDAATGGTILATNSATFTPIMAGTYFVEALDPVTNCTSELIPVMLIINDLPTFVEESTDCSADLLTYSTTITTDADVLMATEGTVINNMDGTFTVSEISGGMGVTITGTNSTTNCAQDFMVLAPDCSCGTINPPVGIDVEICSGEPIPIITVSADTGLEVNWFDAPINGTELVNNSLTFTPMGAGTFYAEALDPITNCSSELVPFILTINDLPAFTEGPKSCSDDLLTYQVTVTTNADIVVSTEGTVSNNMDGSFEILDISEGTEITVTVTNSTTNCTQDFIIIAPDCACPTVNTPVGMDMEICSGEMIPTLTASADMGLEINWYDAEMSGNILATNSATFTPTDEGIFYVEALDPITNCASDLVPISLTINDLPIADAGITDTINCIETSIVLGGINTSMGDDFSYEWTGLSGFLSNEINPEIDFGDTFTLIVTNTITGCVSEPSEVVVTEENAPPIALITADPTNVVDCVVTQIELNAETENNTISTVYEWSYQTITTNGPVFAANSSGSYSLLVVDTLTGCSSSDAITVMNNEGFPIIDFEPFDNLDCNNTSISLDASNSQTSSTITSQWLDLDGNNLSMDVILNTDMPGMYIYQSIDSDNGCINADTLTLTQNIDIPNADAGNNQTLDCVDMTANLFGSSLNTNVSGEWSPAANLVSGINLDVTVNAPAWYYLTITDNENGCTNIDSVFVDQPSVPDNVSVIVEDPNCDETSLGSINITNVSGGTIPYNYGINGNVLSPNPVFTGLNSGTYVINIEDVSGCAWDSTIVIQQETTFSLDLGDDLELELGDSVRLNPVLSIPDTQVDTVIWTATEMISCLDCLNPWVTPSENTVYSVLVQDVNGCTNQDEIVIEVDRQIGVYFPNAFSPNADGVNDFFTVLTGNSVASVNSLNIYDRWGNKVYEALNFDPKTNLGWDGTLNSKNMDSAVFVYFAEIVYLDGSTRTFKGDITLLR